MPVLDVGFSSCPNDTFMFHGLISGAVELAAELRPIIADIEALNLRALDPATAPAITKLSAGVLPRLCERYTVLDAGAALGRGCGPLVVVRPDAQMGGLAALAGKRVAIPGVHTTAHLLLRSFLSELAPGRAELAPEGAFEVEVMRFDRIMDAVVAGRVDAGLIIHESRFTYADHGLVELADLGVSWEQATSLPLPLGMICARRDLGPELIDAFEAALRHSVELAFAEPDRSRAWIREHAQELDDEVCRRHIELYVNEFSVSLGTEGKAAIDDLLRRARASGLAPSGRDPWR